MPHVCIRVTVELYFLISELAFMHTTPVYGPLTRYINYGLLTRRDCRERFPYHRLQRKPLVSEPGMHHGTCVTHVPWCMSESLTRGGGETFLVFPAHAQAAVLRIWQDAHNPHASLAAAIPANEQEGTWILVQWLLGNMAHSLRFIYTKIVMTFQGVFLWKHMLRGNCNSVLFLASWLRRSTCF